MPELRADPTLIYAAGFSNGGGLVWQPLNSDLSGGGRVAPRPAPVCYLQGTPIAATDRPSPVGEQPLDSTLPFSTLTEMVSRNGLTAGAAATTLIPGRTG